MQVRLALVGDYDANVIAHRAIPEALKLAAAHITPSQLKFDWKHTSAIGSLEGYHGVWCVPASPYASEAAAIGAIRWARENGIPFLGTCGGFQHAVLEFARNVMGLSDAAHAETANGADCLVISRLSCSLVEVEQPVFATPGTRLAEIYGSGEIHAGYHCNFGLNPKFEQALERAGMRVAARDANGEPRAVELSSHPFFVGTLFQPERLALKGENSPVVDAFVKAAAVCAQSLRASAPV
ncbi:MAG TPA: CTP synthase [Bryobacteraceae bacterium]|jgi:CTP synthase (UTP-ammonia lyase)|nr:CTP synthase [Bryobacteraceae bacterium]